ncbi:hypothetical protein, partial [Burkholderia glumae]|uniref:hypothetical protein n=1 Tax=Burkholderia glumae TaxID=337 RepID=UPI0020CD439F
RPAIAGGPARRPAGTAPADRLAKLARLLRDGPGAGNEVGAGNPMQQIPTIRAAPGAARPDNGVPNARPRGRRAAPCGSGGARRVARHTGTERE